MATSRLDNSIVTTRQEEEKRCSQLQLEDLTANCEERAPLDTLTIRRSRSSSQFSSLIMYVGLYVQLIAAVIAPS